MDFSLAFFVSYALLWFLVICLALIVVALVRTLAAIRLEGAGASGNGDPVGETVPEFKGIDIRGAPFDSRDLAGRARAFLFVSTTCRSCITTLDELRALKTKAGGAVVVICRDRRQDCIQLLGDDEIEARVVVDEEHAISDLFGISSVPTAVLVDRNDTIERYGYPKREDIERVATAEVGGSQGA